MNGRSVDLNQPRRELARTAPLLDEWERSQFANKLTFWEA